MPEDVIDFVELRSQKDEPLDFVEMVWDNPHARVCRDYKPYINEGGTVYCKACEGVSVASVNGAVEPECPSCGCAVHKHNFFTSDGRVHCPWCGNRGCEC